MTATKKQNPIQYLTKSDVEDFCFEIAERIFDNQEPLGVFSDHQAHKLDACLSLPAQRAFGQDLYPTLFDKAAILFFALNRNHPFGNGNKRISAASLVVFLYLNDFLVTAPNNDLYQKTLWLATTTDDLQSIKADLVLWLEDNTIEGVEESILPTDSLAGDDDEVDKRRAA